MLGPTFLTHLGREAYAAAIRSAAEELRSARTRLQSEFAVQLLNTLQSCNCISAANGGEQSHRKL